MYQKKEKQPRKLFFNILIKTRAPESRVKLIAIELVPIKLVSIEWRGITIKWARVKQSTP
jgi:hypothetical protein